MPTEEKSKKEPLKPVFVSPAEAFDKHLETHHNIGAVTPEYLKGQNEQVNAVRAEGDKQVNRINQTADSKAHDDSRDYGIPIFDKGRAEYRKSLLEKDGPHQDKEQEKTKDKDKKEKNKEAFQSKAKDRDRKKDKERGR